jgi:hypothetical protein
VRSVSVSSCSKGEVVQWWQQVGDKDSESDEDGSDDQHNPYSKQKEEPEAVHEKQELLKQKNKEYTMEGFELDNHL